MKCLQFTAKSSKSTMLQCFDGTRCLSHTVADFGCSQPSDEAQEDNLTLVRCKTSQGLGEVLMRLVVDGSRCWIVAGADPGFVQFQGLGRAGFAAAIEIVGQVLGDSVEPGAQSRTLIAITTDMFNSTFENLGCKFFGQIGIANAVVKIAKQATIVAIINRLPGSILQTFGAFEQRGLIDINR